MNWFFRLPYDTVGPSINGFSVAALAGSWFHINSSGERAYDQKFDYVSEFSEQRARARKNGRWFHINPNGRPAYKKRYVQISDFTKGKAWVSEGDVSYWIDKDGNKLS